MIHTYPLVKEIKKPPPPRLIYPVAQANAPPLKNFFFSKRFLLSRKRDARGRVRRSCSATPIKDADSCRECFK